MQGMAADAGFRTAVDMLDRLDPHRIFSTPFLDRLMPRSRDLTSDGQVNDADLAELLGRWTGGEAGGWLGKHGHSSSLDRSGWRSDRHRNGLSATIGYQELPSSGQSPLSGL
jgi:hypothetical protein